MRGEGVGVIAWQAHIRGSVADETAHLLHLLLKDSPLLHVVQQPRWYDPVKGPSHVEEQ